MNKKISSLAGIAILVVVAAAVALVLVYQNWNPEPVAENSPTPTQSVSSTPTPKESFGIESILKNINYRKYSEIVPEEAGFSRIDRYLIADLNKDKRDDAVVITATSLGGSGVFYEIFAVFESNGSVKISSGKTLGDRIKINRIYLPDGEIIGVDFNDHGPDQAMAESPTLQKFRYFLVNSQFELEDYQISMN